MSKEFKDIQKIIGVEFKNQLLLKEALTHRSFLNENENWPVFHNERMEFLGDAVLELVVTKFLFEKFPDDDEGKLTSVRSALVDHNMLSNVAETIKLDDFIYLSKGEAKADKRSREAIISNAVEAIIGAIYLGQGYEEAKGFIKQFILSQLDKIMEAELYRDSKSLLQELVQEKMNKTPHYEVIKETGPDHRKKFTVGVYFGEELIIEGDGDSKQDAERASAENALDKLDLQ